MADGKTHDNVMKISLLPIFLAGVYLFKFSLTGAAIFTVFAGFSQFMFGPDLDSKKSFQYKRWGLLKTIWLPYRIIFPHRSKFSHGMITGPVFRIIYLLIVWFLFFWLLNYLIYKAFGFDLVFIAKILIAYVTSFFHTLNTKGFIVPIVAGIFTGAAIHTLTDKFTAFFKNLL
jgi:uncharacterized metal-binding protein